MAHLALLLNLGLEASLLRILVPEYLQNQGVCLFLPTSVVAWGTNQEVLEHDQSQVSYGGGTKSCSLLLLTLRRSGIPSW